jgi:DNA primase
VEGYLDLLALAQVGITNVVATCGTAFTPDQARLIKRGARNVLLVFDGDKAGLKAAVRSADIALRGGLEPRIVQLPRGQDPADVVIGQGVAAMRGALEAGLGYVPFLKSLADARGGDREVSERAVRQALGTIAGVGDALRREYLLQEVAEVFGLGEDLVRAEVAKEAAAQPAARPRPARKGREPDEAAGTEPAPPATEKPRGRRGGPAVRRRLSRVNTDAIETDMLAHIMGDDSGDAARVFLAERGDLPLHQPAAAILADELAAWRDAGAAGPPRRYVLDRWNTSGDGAYRGYVSRLISKEDRPESTDFTRVVRDCLGRLKADSERRRMAAGHGDDVPGDGT